MKLKDTPIQLKLMRVILLTSGAVLVLTCTAYFTYELVTFRGSTRNHLTMLGQIIADNSTAALAFDSKEDAKETLTALRADKHVVAACLYDKNGQLFSWYPVYRVKEDFPERPGKEGYHFNDSYLEGFQPVVQGDDRLGTLYLKSDMNAMYDRFRLFGLIAFTVITCSFVFAYFLSKYLQKTISKPILDLAETAKIVSDQRDYSVRAVRSGEDELGLLTDAFNHMLEQIEIKNSAITTFNQQLEQKIKERTTELEFANNVLQEQNEFVQTIIDSSVDVIAVFDKDLNYVILNKHSDDVYPKKREEMIGKNIVDIFPETLQSGMVENLRRALKGEVIHDTKYLSPVLNRHFENFYIPLKDNGGKIYRVLTIGHDVTNIMEANEKLQTLNSELEKSNRDLEQFASIASHDLQEPLRKIQTFAELAERNFNNEEAIKKYLSKINSSAQRMAHLIRAVLNYSRLSGSDNTFEKVDLNEIVESIQTDLELIIQEKHAVINMDKFPPIHGNALQLNQLFLNLISNSLKFSEKTPIINIRCRVLQEKEISRLIKKRLQGSFVEILFEDNGIGFEQQFADRIFTIFQRLHSNRSYPGTGIGLALCKKIVENHGGFIMVKSMPGEGTVFNIYLPV